MRLDFTSDLTTLTSTLAATLYNDIRSARHNNRKWFPVLTGNAPCRTSSATPRQAQIHSIARSQAGSGSTAAAAPPHTPMAHTHVHIYTHTHTHTYTHSGYASAAASGCVTASKRCVIFFYIYFMILFLFFFFAFACYNFYSTLPSDFAVAAASHPLRVL